MIDNHFGDWLKNESEEETKKIGRPRAITQKSVQKLKWCFSAGMSVREALYWSGIKKSTFYKYLQENPDFMDTIEFIKQSTTLQAKFNIQNEIKKWSVSDSWRWLEKKLPEEFWNKVGVELSKKPQEKMTKEQEEIYKQIVNHNL